MNLLQSLLFFVVSLAASVVGAICGIGGGVIIKPTLDVFGWASASTISFLSGCTVLSMSCYSVVKSMRSGERQVNLRTGTSLAIGSVIGGVAGKQLFTYLQSLFSNPERIGAVQALCLGVITLGTLLYTLRKNSIRTHHILHPLACILIGLILGICSSFLGIGGGPINLVVLYYFFSMDTKTAAANSLYIILFSQIASLVTTVLTGTIPVFAPITLILMICGGIWGGILGRIINRKLSNLAVEKLFIALMVLIIGICIYNTIQ
ncbi:sulfite exporter TauE/SafE family protein [Agathobaculum sp. Marseille-P7918]|uniref:sulfite exporter TauE/SafE family protein n=1 Tax=Agathobaculum sp. Marseille-P7918 TaxID=2479843 RepID=UPI00356680F7